MNKKQAKKRCREILKEIKAGEKTKRGRFKKWFKSKGEEYKDEFGDWYGPFTREDHKCRDWDLLIYHWDMYKKHKQDD